MNKELAKELLEIVQLSKEGVLQGIDLVSEQAPEITRQIILFKVVAGIMHILLTVLLLFISYKSIGKFEKKLEEENIIKIMCYVGIYILTFFVTAILLLESPSYLKAIIAPKLYLLDYLGNFL